MPVPTSIGFNDYLKAVEILAKKLGYSCRFSRSSGSAIRIELFGDGDEVPSKMWVVHEDLREKKIYSKDLKKACLNIGVVKRDFDDLIKNKFK